MQKNETDRLVQKLVKLFDQTRGSALPTLEQESLRLRIGELLEAPGLEGQTVDSRCVTILLSDLRGFVSAFERHTALEMVEVLNRYFKRMSEIIVRYGGAIDKFMGDSIMALFGAPVMGENDLESALACAIEMQLAMKEFNEENKALGVEPIYMGIGINTGEVVAGHLGSSLHSEYTVIGSQVNLASRVEAHSLRGQILLSENTYLLAKDFIKTGVESEIKVKGRRESLRVYELLSTSRPKYLRSPQREMRTSRRAEIDMPLTFTLLSGKILLAQEYEGRGIDISHNGMYFISPVLIEAFSDVSIKLSHASMGLEETQVYAKVMRVWPMDSGCGCHVEFTAIDAAAASAIKRFVDAMVEIGARF
jgi:adenylate cyclase